jgi:hypothetical protein
MTFSDDDSRVEVGTFHFLTFSLFWYHLFHAVVAFNLVGSGRDEVQKYYPEFCIVAPISSRPSCSTVDIRRAMFQTNFINQNEDQTEDNQIVGCTCHMLTFYFSVLPVAPIETAKKRQLLLFCREIMERCAGRTILVAAVPWHLELLPLESCFVPPAAGRSARCRLSLTIAPVMSTLKVEGFIMVSPSPMVMVVLMSSYL